MPLFLDVFDDDQKTREKLDLFSRLLSESGVFELLRDENTIPANMRTGQPSYDRKMMLLATVLSFAFGAQSLREIEEKCRYDLRLIYSTGSKKPSYASFCNFINDYVVGKADEIFTGIVSAISGEMGTDVSGDVFIDGSKFEANSNKYKFVWKPTRKMDKLMAKFRSMMEAVGISVPDDTPPMTAMATSVSMLSDKLRASGIGPDAIATGRGKRTSPEEKAYVESGRMIGKMMAYAEDVRICGENRNSYYKTDRDATAMNLKEDYYSGAGSNMHAAYNVQLAVCQGIIVGYYVSRDRNDTKTFPIFVNKLYSLWGRYPKNICADAGYGSHENYRYVHEKRIGNYLKYGSWTGEIGGDRPQLYHLRNGKVCCLDEREMVETGSGRGYTYFRVDCHGCKLKKYCLKATKLRKNSTARTFRINLEWLRYREEAKSNLLSAKGIELRVNRSIQIEGTFGNVKQNLSYERFSRRGLEKVNAEMMLICLAVNIRKLFAFWDENTLPAYWKAPEDLRPEEPKPISRTVRKGGKKKAKPQPNQMARKSIRRKR